MGEEISSDKDRIGPLGLYRPDEFLVPVGLTMQVGDEEASGHRAHQSGSMCNPSVTRLSYKRSPVCRATYLRTTALEMYVLYKILYVKHKIFLDKHKLSDYTMIMSIQVNLDLVLVKRKMKLTELSERIGISVTNLSLLKTGRVKGMRFSTLDAICRELDCQPGDILEYAPDYV